MRRREAVRAPTIGAPPRRSAESRRDSKTLLYEPVLQTMVIWFHVIIETIKVIMHRS